MMAVTIKGNKNTQIIGLEAPPVRYSKYAKARELGVTILDEGAFRDLLKGGG